MDRLPAYAPYPARLLAGVMEHLACYLQSGRTQSAHQALILLASLAATLEPEDDLGHHCRHLHDVIEDSLAPQAVCPGRLAPVAA